MKQDLVIAEPKNTKILGNISIKSPLRAAVFLRGELKYAVL